MTSILYFTLLLVALGVILALVQWIMVCQAKRTEGSKAPDTSVIDNPGNYPLRVYYFYSQNCGPCRSIRPMVDKLRKQYPNLIKVDIGEHAQLARDFGVAGVPSFIAVEDEVITDVKLGRVSESWLLKWLAK
ncbi:MAG: thioredoxin family protein [Gammaproteobacteria bacterium]|nr:thioredoxin family protein [Gammaproteobacteria bacterium]